MIKINVDTRIWEIPEEEKILGVESDDKVKTLQFELSKNEFYNGLNFTDCNCFINYKNEYNDTIPYGITDMELQEDGTVTFTWEVSRGATISKGNTVAILCVKKVREDGTITNEWNSRVGTFRVNKGLEPSNSIVEKPEIDIISQLLAVAQQANTNAQTNIDQSEKLIEQSNSLLEKAEGLGYLKEDFDVLEARMDQFTSLEEGSTTGDAELIDGRIGYDGTVYDNIGGAIRKQVSELKGDLADLATFEKSANMINPLELKNGWLSASYNTIVDTLTEDPSYKSVIFDGTYPKGTKFIINHPFGFPKGSFIQFSQSTRKVSASYRDLTLREDGLYEFTTTENDRGIAVIFDSIFKDYYVSLESEYLKNKLIKPYGFKDIYVNDDTVRKESLSDDVVEYIENPNFIKLDYKEVNLITEISSNKYVKADGTLAADSNLSCTNYIELEDGKNYYWSSLFNGYYAFYDEDKALVEGHGNDSSLTNPITVPGGAKYVRLSMYLQNESKVWVNFKNRKPTNTIRYALREDIYTNHELHPSPCEYEDLDISAFTSCICIGDSLTEGVFNVNGTESSRTYPTMNYPKYLEKMTGISVTNAGHAGKTSVQWWDSYGSQDFSNHQMAIIQLGVNDYYFIGHDWSDTNKQAFINIINKLKSDNNNIKIFVATIIPAKYYPASDFANISQGIRDLVAELNDPNVILIDIAKYGHTNDEDAYNTGHLSAYGYWRLAKDYVSYISWYMHNNPSVFKEIQFIGTDLTSGY